MEHKCGGYWNKSGEDTGNWNVEYVNGTKVWRILEQEWGGYRELECGVCKWNISVEDTGIRVGRIQGIGMWSIWNISVKDTGTGVGRKQGTGMWSIHGTYVSEEETGKGVWRRQGTGVWRIQVKECGGYRLWSVEDTGKGMWRIKGTAVW